MASSASSSKPKRKRVMEENAFRVMASVSPSKLKCEMEELQGNSFKEMAPTPPSKQKCEMGEKGNNVKEMAPALPSDQSFHPYDVFINHCNPDVGKTVASVLYQFLQYLGLNVFLHSTDLQLGDSLPANIQHVIRSSSVHIAILSKGYSYTPWCLAELCLMLKTGSKIVPLFYDVATSDLRYIGKGVYADAFATHTQSKRDMPMQWKDALYNVSLISGIEFDSSNGNLGELCKNIVDTVLIELREAKTKLKLEVTDHLVGLEEAMEELEGTISTTGWNYNGNGVIVGIVGRAGIGKTTLAKEFFNRKHPSFCKSSFLFDVGEAHRTEKMGKMQDKLMSDVSMPLPLSTSTVRPGSHEEYWYFKPLIILDGVDHADQLRALSLNDFLNQGALVIVTCHDANVMQSFKMVKIYEMRGLDSVDARKLFCWHAFRQSHPPKGCDKLVELHVRVSRGLPLDLKVLGENIYSLKNEIHAQL
ncbi:hypothetical protein SUGI_0674680 [Cryptomeria japonica]|uniref:disease resistance protein Roq1-like n=1 Tax=Cryptomeria japonica TaxID=3369 RepID=UPI002414AFDC|nr:disease resistance protein Roq1-like [Cryptomeria japonica]GLJ33551.1 hypothetical protein SUGI_0674680 [Cryptomeria japonica]